MLVEVGVPVAGDGGWTLDRSGTVGVVTICGVVDELDEELSSVDDVAA